MSEEIKNILGQRIKEQRKKLKLTNIDIANELEVHKSTVSNWIAGHRVPEAQTLYNLAKILNTSVDYLTGKTTDPLPFDAKVDVKKMLNNRELVYDDKPITEEQRVMFLSILESIIEPKLNNRN
ncbi:helix-turn-helix domain-containing protein [Priestia aryabhattai]